MVNALLCCLWLLFLGMLLGMLLSWLLGLLLGKGSSDGEASTPDSRPPQFFINMPSGYTGAPTTAVIDLEAARRAGIAIHGPGHLEIIEGIGPEIAAVLRAQGLPTLYHVAHAGEQQISELLRQAGHRFDVANTPGTWSLQAMLLVTHRWEDFTRYTGYLKNGRPPDSGPKQG